MKTHNLFVSRFLLTASFLALCSISYFSHVSYIYPSWWMEIGQDWAMVVTTGAPLLFFLLFTLVWPRPGGIVVVIFGIWQTWLQLAGMPRYTVPLAVIVLLYVLFTAGGALSFAGAKPYTPFRVPGKSLYYLLTAARILALGTIILNVLVYAFLYPPVILGSFPGLIVFLIARKWPAPGGVLILSLAVSALFQLQKANWELAWKIPVHIFIAMFMLSGLLYLFTAWRHNLTTRINSQPPSGIPTPKQV